MKLRVLVLMHEDLVPPDDLTALDDKQLDRIKTERDVVDGLKDLGHEVFKLGVWDELRPLRAAIEEWDPHVVFNLLEEFHGEAVYDQHVVSYLELMRVPYTGCNPRGLVLARDKALSKKILHYHRIRVPRFMVVPLRRRARRRKGLEFPLIVKSLIEEASTGIAQASVVDSDDKLEERVRFVHEHVRTDAIVEQYVEGRELYVGILGNRRLSVLPVWELKMDELPEDARRIATRRLKIDVQYQRKHGIIAEEAKDLSDATRRHIVNTSKRIYRALDLSGYARLDYRLAPDGRLYFLEANPNPEIAQVEEFACASAAAGMSFEKMLSRIVGLGIRAAG